MTLAEFGAPQARALIRWIELGVIALVVAVPLASWWIIARGPDSALLLTPPLVALMLVANLLPGMALLVLVGRRIAMRRAAASPIGGEGRLHVRLVALFSAVAAVPTLFVVIFASLLFQYGVEFWFSDRARGVLENSYAIAREVYQAEVDRVTRETRTMRDDLRGYLRLVPMESRAFQEGYAVQVLKRELSESMIVQFTAGQPARRLIMVNPYERNDIERLVTPELVAKLRAGAPAVVIPERDRIGLLTVFDPRAGTYLYAARVFDPQINAQLRRGERVLSDYRTLIDRSRSLQLQFNAALLLISLLIVGLAVWVALAVADRLVRPVGELVAAARAVAEGDLSARVAQPRRRDEIGTLARAFNAMTGQLEAQTGALVAANDQLESRRALIEAVMSGVSAGVISIDRDRAVRLINDSAAALLGVRGSAVGRPLAALSPELDALLGGDAREAVVQIVAGGEARTLAVKIAFADAGPILTFDDITQQLLDQRRAAWADVARRIAHEIKNPLTPIQLAAERLQRRYGKNVPADDGTFARLTETIVRQVGDLRRMVDEFSSFARMPKPVFRDEALLDIARQVMFLHEVAHAGIAFRLNHDEPPPVMRCDRRQLGQALTNLVKNAVEAIESKGDGGEKLLEMTLAETPTAITISVADSGVGLPIERDRIVEPYMTTRARGTGLGLAIVKKIAEEHGGAIAFADRPGGGTIVTLAFDKAALAALACGTPDQPCGDDDARPAMLTRFRK
ncbi:MAG: PAS domain-containing sensor histidine kinase [Proteobacteria bacterium SG_bin5]|nr:MAG: PAS domain-containing sensor histidine kinase [Proteobacteria bacterium SG_bin5]